SAGKRGDARRGLEFRQPTGGDCRADCYGVCSTNDTFIFGGIWSRRKFLGGRCRRLRIYVGPDREDSGALMNRLFRFCFLTGFRVCGIENRTHRTGRDATVNEESLACDIAARFRSKKDDSRIQIVRFAWPLYRYPIAQIVDPFLVLVQNFVLICAEPTRR